MVGRSFIFGGAFLLTLCLVRNKSGEALPAWFQTRQSDPDERILQRMFAIDQHLGHVALFFGQWPDYLFLTVDSGNIFMNFRLLLERIKMIDCVRADLSVGEERLFDL